MQNPADLGAVMTALTTLTDNAKTLSAAMQKAIETVPDARLKGFVHRVHALLRDLHIGLANAATLLPEEFQQQH